VSPGGASGPAPAAPRRQGYLSLGSNLGERRSNLQAAIDQLKQHGVVTLRSSSVYDTEPVGLVLDQPEFLNACIEIETGHDPETLLTACKDSERELGRTTGIRHGPRVIDIDVLMLTELADAPGAAHHCGPLTHSSERLNVPHRELVNRRFVLVPLLELDPELTLPSGLALKQALADLGGAQDVRLAGPRLSV
jgi:2-amino-4-hydroxy-6-hydroxymethyldihydropteridine diphosphokinase